MFLGRFQTQCRHLSFKAFLRESVFFLLLWHFEGDKTLKISGFLKTSLTDYPNKVCSVIFIGGCNLRCPFCHNATIVTGETTEISQREVVKFLEKRKNMLDGVCVTGGEPLAQNDIEGLLLDIKNLGLFVKLDTNGFFPDKLKMLIDKKLVDYVAVDIKNSFERYSETVGVKNVDVSPVKKTIELVLQDNVDYEFRTTVARPLHDTQSILKAAEQISGAKRYFLQRFVPSDNLVGQSCTAFAPEVYQQFLIDVQSIVPNTVLR